MMFFARLNTDWDIVDLSASLGETFPRIKHKIGTGIRFERRVLLEKWMRSLSTQRSPGSSVYPPPFQATPYHIGNSKCQVIVNG